jgi:hypothetical protein
MYFQINQCIPNPSLIQSPATSDTQASVFLLAYLLFLLPDSD